MSLASRPCEKIGAYHVRNRRFASEPGRSSTDRAPWLGVARRIKNAGSPLGGALTAQRPPQPRASHLSCGPGVSGRRDEILQHAAGTELRESSLASGLRGHDRYSRDIVLLFFLNKFQPPIS